MSKAKSRRHSNYIKRSQRDSLRILLEELGNHSAFCSAVATLSSNRTATLNNIILDVAASLNTTFAANNPLRSILSELGNVVSPSPSIAHLQAQFAHYKKAQSDHKTRQHVAFRLGLHSANRLSTVPIYSLSRRCNGDEYPLPDHFILERSDLPIPSSVPIRDRTCGQCSKFHVLNESRLTFTLSANHSAIFVDDITGDVVAIVLRDFQQSHFTITQPWSVDLIHESINRRYLSQRNGPGQLARVGVSEGARSARLFGWVRNLKQKYRTISDRQEHDQKVASLFGLFYGLLRGQLSWLATIFENAMVAVQLPRLDSNQLGEFSIPIGGTSITFNGYPLAPPEGYMAINYVKQIHKDKHWSDCSWGCYWNILRMQNDNHIGLESGASFFIADYGLRIVNASNTCVAWKISLWHGTGWYYNDVTQIGIAFLLSKATETTWKEYLEKIQEGKLRDGDLVWNVEMHNME